MAPSRKAEAWDAAGGGLLLGAIVVVVGGVVALAGWAAGNFETAGIVLGCVVLSATVAVAVRELLRWGIDDKPKVASATLARLREDARMKRAA